MDDRRFRRGTPRTRHRIFDLLANSGSGLHPRPNRSRFDPWQLQTTKARLTDHLNSSTAFGQKTSPPMTTAPIAARRTAPAATSLAFSASGWNSGDATSVRNSNAVLSASAVHTEPIARTIQAHDDAGNSTANPAATTMTVAPA